MTRKSVRFSVALIMLSGQLPCHAAHTVTMGFPIE